MSTIKKMIINRNDLEFIYAEKQKNMMGNITYLIYHQNTKPFVYSEETFHSIYGEDKKYPLITFISSVEDRLLELDINNDKKLSYILKGFFEVSKKINGKNYANPSLWGYKSTFITAIGLFNTLITVENNKQYLSNTHDYEEEYQRLIKKEIKQEN